MKKLTFIIDENLIISRLLQKELSHKANIERISQKHIFDPLTYNMPIKIALSLETLGTKIISAHIERGFYYQGLENRLPLLNYKDALEAMALLNEHTPIFYQHALCLAMEELCGLDCDAELINQRSWILSYARVYHHVRVLKELFTCLELDTLSDLALTALSMMSPYSVFLTRIHTDHFSWPYKNQEIAPVLENLESIFHELESNFKFNNTHKFFHKKAIITLNMAASFGLSGIYLRANRSNYEKSTYNEHSLEISDGGDALARILLRLRDIRSFTRWLKENLSPHYGPLVDTRDLAISQTLSSSACGEVFGPEGDIKMSIFLDKQKIPSFHLRSPAYFIAQAIPHLIIQEDIQDLLWILHSLGISAEEIDK
jgi:NADH:ubiquinone oxidoreductase subunit D